MVNLKPYLRRSLTAALLACLMAALVSCGGAGDSSSNAPARPSDGTTPSRPAGPIVRLEPAAGPPGTEVAVSGSGWPAGAEVLLIGPARGTPYLTINAGADGSFAAKFRLEKQPDGSELKVGRYDLTARSGSTDVTLQFLVETARPVARPGDGG